MRPTMYGIGDHEPATNCTLQLVGADRRQVVCLFAVIQMKKAGLASSGHMPTRVLGPRELARDMKKVCGNGSEL